MLSAHFFCGRHIASAVAGLPAVALAKAGCRIPVVRTIRVRADWVRFPAARHKTKMTLRGHFSFCIVLGIEILSS